MKNQAIGFLDSGVGGLSVVKEVMKRLPDEQVIFIGDTARNPYGNRTTEEVIQFSRELADFLIRKEIKMLVVACNTATAAALEVLEKELSIPVIGVIEPGSKSAIEHTKNNEIGVIGTVSTINSNEHRKKIKSLSPLAEIHTLAVPKFVEIVENNDLTSEHAKSVIQEELKRLKDTKIDTLILGCTHYPLLERLIQDYLGNEITLIDPAILTTQLIKEYLTENNLLNKKIGKSKKSVFYTTAEAERFELIARNWIPIGDFEVVNIDLEEIRKSDE